MAPSPIRPEPVEACPEGTRRACTEGHTKEAARAPFHRDRKVPRQHPPRRQSLRKQRVVVIVQGSAVRAGTGGRRVTPRPAPHEGRRSPAVGVRRPARLFFNALGAGPTASSSPELQWESSRQ